MEETILFPNSAQHLPPTCQVAPVANGLSLTTKSAHLSSESVLASLSSLPPFTSPPENVHRPKCNVKYQGSKQSWKI